MQRLFSVDGKTSAEMWKSWSAISAREFYDGDIEVEAGANPDFVFEKSLCFPVSLTRLSARCAMSYRRTWNHIRNNKVGFRVIWFVSRGTFRISRSEGTFDIGAGQAGIIDTNSPFHCKFLLDSEGRYESHQLIVPAYLFLSHLQGADHLSKPFDLANSGGQLVRQMLSLLIAEGENLSRNVAKPLIDSLLEAVAECVGRTEMDTTKRQSLVDKRLSDIENYILMNLTDPDLCNERVAANCGISPRYLCYVLKANNTSFSELLWKNRLPKAKDLLVSPATRDFPIHEIAFMSGFKSAAHFSRMFKAAYGCAPREFRNAYACDDADLQVSGDEIGVGAKGFFKEAA